MCDKIPFFDFFERFVPPREIGLALHDAEVLGGSLDAKNRAMEVDVRCSEPLPEALVATIRQLLMEEYDLVSCGSTSTRATAQRTAVTATSSWARPLPAK